LRELRGGISPVFRRRFISHPPTLQRLDLYQLLFMGVGQEGFSPLPLRVVGGIRYKMGVGEKDD